MSAPLTDMAAIDALGAFCRTNNVTRTHTSPGPLSGLGFAAKDVFDIAGSTAGNGQPDWLRTHAAATETAPAVADILAAGADLVGRTVSDEMCYSLTGENHHYGTPLNPAAPACVPGGSSSGSASAVAARAADFALGTDCGGSVRTPASYCGLFGMRPTHGRIPLTGIVPFAPSFDTVGWFAREAAVMHAVGRVLLHDRATARPFERLVIADDAFAALEPPLRAALAPAVDRIAEAIPDRRHVTVAADGLAAWSATFRVLQGAEIWASVGAWVEATGPIFGPGVRERFETARTIDADAVATAAKQREAIVAEIDRVVPPGTVMVLPTVPRTAPPRGGDVDEVEIVYRHAAMNLLCIAGLAGLPQISLPIATVDGRPLGLSLIAPRGADIDLLMLAELLAAPTGPLEIAGSPTT
ncbi:amidase [Acuticoccus sp. I52.16.1]|uniref:amidase n=1 Tax=Acuticoccus sp. I52.16.1 TaxID=2928472 RepID=UPI001FD4734E|nr:amidase [Acuticoccus sp. I52.16.1]UOM33891.1 amidase [Acuticoccus sp. I52.16.1]